MTIGTTVCTITTEGNGVTTAFTYPFLIPAASDAVVIFTDTNGNQSTLTTTQYTISGVGSVHGGTVTYPLAGAPIAIGTSLTIERVLPLVQTTSISNQGPVFQAIETEFDYEMMCIQQVSFEIGRAIKAPATDPAGLNYTVPSVSQRAGQMLSFDSFGNVIVAQPSSALVSAAMQPVVSSNTLSYAASLLGVGDWVSAFSYMTAAQIADVIAGTLTQDVTAALNSALATGDNLKLPSGAYLVSNVLNVNSIGQIVAGDGIGNTTISVTASFNLSAPGVFYMSASTGTSAPAPTIRDMDIFFHQIDTANKSSLIEFPPAIYITGNTLRWTMERLRIIAGWNGIYAYTTNSLGISIGGGYIYDCQLGCLNQNIFIDGASDSIRMKGNHIWPFGLTANQQNIFLTPGASGSFGITLNRCDDYHIDDNLFFCGNSLLLTASVNGVPYGECTNNNFNFSNGILMFGGYLSGAGNWFGVGTASSAIAILGSPANSVFCSLAATQIQQSVSTTGIPLISITNGNIQMSGVTINVDGISGTGVVGINAGTGSNAFVAISDMQVNQAAVDAPAVLIEGAGAMNVGLTNCFFARTANTVYVNPTVSLAAASTNAILRMSNCGMSPLGSGTGGFFTIGVDNYHRIIGNSPNGWAEATPSVTHAVYMFN